MNLKLGVNMEKRVIKYFNKTAEWVHLRNF